MGIFDFLKKARSKNIEAFPSIESVFETEVELSKKVFFPVCSVPLNAINPAWGEEKIHLIQFNEDPYNEENVKYFNEYCKDCMIAFELNDGKYQFKSDYKFFDLTEEWQEWFDQTKSTYEASKQQFLTSGNKFGIDRLPLGGQPDWWQYDETPLDPDGNPMTFITEFETDAICDDSCDKKIYLFYSHKHKLAVQIYQIT